MLNMTSFVRFKSNFFVLLNQEFYRDIFHVQNIIYIFLKPIFPQPVTCNQQPQVLITRLNELVGSLVPGTAQITQAQVQEKFLRLFTEIYPNYSSPLITFQCI